MIVGDEQGSRNFKLMKSCERVQWRSEKKRREGRRRKQNFKLLKGCERVKWTSARNRSIRTKG